MLNRFAYIRLGVEILLIAVILSLLEDGEVHHYQIYITTW